MDRQFEWWAYLLILAALFAHYPFGRRLGVQGFLSRVLAGLSLSALLVGVLANVAAAWIKPYVISTVVIGYGLWVWDVLHAPRVRLRHADLRRIAFCALVGVLVFAANEPDRTFLERSGEKVFLLFNPHYPAYAGLSYEMLQAGYVDRLKIPTAHPIEIAKNHFFPAAAQAIGQVFIDSPGLLSYFAVQTVLIVLILLSFAEMLRPVNIRTAILFLVWLAIGFTLLTTSLKWTFTTSALFSTFAVVQLAGSLYRGRIRAAVVYLHIAAASLVGLVPVVAITLAAWCGSRLLGTGIAGARSVLNQLRPFDVGAFLIFCAYNLVTIFSGYTTSEYPTMVAPAHLFIWPGAEFGFGWLYSLLTYELYGFIASKLAAIGPFQFPLYNYLGFFDRVQSSAFAETALVTALALVALWLLGRVWTGRIALAARLCAARSWSEPLLPIAFVSIAWIVWFWTRGLHANLAQYMLLSGPYFIGLFLLWRGRGATRGDGFLVVLTLAFATWLYLFFAILPVISAPAATLFFDVLIWALAGNYLTRLRSRWQAAAALAFACLCIAAIPNGLVGIARFSDKKDLTRVDITPLTGPQFRRERFVDPQNYMAQGNAPVLDEAYTSVLGANMRYHVENSGFLMYRKIPDRFNPKLQGGSNK